MQLNDISYSVQIVTQSGEYAHVGLLVLVRIVPRVWAVVLLVSTAGSEGAATVQWLL